MSKTNEIKNKIRQRDARSSLMGCTNEITKKLNKENVKKWAYEKEEALVEKTTLNKDL